MTGARPTIVLIPLLLASLAACADGGAPAAEASVRDSAGITIVENAGQAESWRVAAEPSVDIGVLEGEPEYQLFNARGAVRLSDGRIVILNAGTHELRFYDAEGRHLLSAGRQGGGPGEFQQMAGPWRMGGDSLLVYDWSESRASVFAPDGTFARSFRLQTGEGIQFPQPTGVAAGLRHQPAGLAGTRHLIARAGRVFMSGQERSGLSRDSTTLLRYDLEGALQDTVATLPGPESYVKSSGNSISVRSLPFGRDLRIALAGEHLVGGSNGRPELGVRSLDGELVRLVRWSQPVRAVTPEDVADFKAREAARLEEEDLPESFRTGQLAMLEELPYPEAFPAFDNVMADEDEHIWVQAASPPGITGRAWMVFDPEGRLLAAVEMPEDLVVRQIGRDWVLGTWRDDFDVEHVRVHGLERAPRAG